MTPALLDVNVLLALAWPNHQHHGVAHAWFAAHAKRGWATCAITQLGFVRLSANPAFTDQAVRPREAASLLAQWTALATHRFWTSPRADDPANYAHAIGHLQVNDAWLVGAARAHSGKLVTLDSRLVVHAGNDRFVEVIAG